MFGLIPNRKKLGFEDERERCHGTMVRTPPTGLEDWATHHLDPNHWTLDQELTFVLFGGKNGKMGVLGSFCSSITSLIFFASLKFVLRLCRYSLWGFWGKFGAKNHSVRRYSTRRLIVVAVLYFTLLGQDAPMIFTFFISLSGCPDVVGAQWMRVWFKQVSFLAALRLLFCRFVSTSSLMLLE